MCLTHRTNEAQLRELQDHPVLRRELKGKVLHSGKVVGLGNNVILQLKEQRYRKNKNKTEEKEEFKSLGLLLKERM